jgi:hypothetical protein
MITKNFTSWAVGTVAGMALLAFGANVAEAAVTGLNGDVLVGTAAQSGGGISDPSIPFSISPGGVSEANELAWLKALTGKDGLTVISRTNIPDGVEGCKTDCSIMEKDGKSFGYFIVKASTNLFAFKNGGDLFKAEYSGLANGTSHVTFVTPIPAAGLLLLAGLGGLAAVHRYGRKPAA